MAIALLMGPLSRVATASNTGPRSTWIPDGGGCGGVIKAEDIPPTTAPNNPPATASCTAVLLSSDESSLVGDEVDSTDDEDDAVDDVDDGLITVLADEGTFTSVTTD